MYHPGKIVEIFSDRGNGVASAEATTQATVEMWDDNILTFSVHPKLKQKIKAGDLVLVDYTPVQVSKMMAAPRNLIVKILRDKSGERVWDKYREFHKNRAATMMSAQSVVAPQAPAMYR